MLYVTWISFNVERKKNPKKRVSSKLRDPKKDQSRSRLWFFKKNKNDHPPDMSFDDRDPKKRQHLQNISWLQKKSIPFVRMLLLLIFSPRPTPAGNPHDGLQVNLCLPQAYLTPILRSCTTEKRKKRDFSPKIPPKNHHQIRVRRAGSTPKRSNKKIFFFQPSASIDKKKHSVNLYVR